MLLENIASEVRCLSDLRKVIRKVRRTPENGGLEIMEQTGIDEDGWADIDSRVRRKSSLTKLKANGFTQR